MYADLRDSDAFGRQKRTRITKIDLTGGALHNLSALEVCDCLDTIIADECQLSDADLTYLPALPDSLRALSLNKNRIESLLGFIGYADVSFFKIHKKTFASGSEIAAWCIW